MGDRVLILNKGNYQNHHSGRVVLLDNSNTVNQQNQLHAHNNATASGGVVAANGANAYRFVRMANVTNLAVNVNNVNDPVQAAAAVLQNPHVQLQLKLPEQQSKLALHFQNHAIRVFFLGECVSLIFVFL